MFTIRLCLPSCLRSLLLYAYNLCIGIYYSLYYMTAYVGNCLNNYVENKLDENRISFPVPSV